MQTLEVINNLVENIEKVIIGKRQTIELTVLALLSDGHVLIEDVPGVGKTSLVAALAKSLDCSFKRIQFTADIMPSDITGFSIYNQKSGNFEFCEGAVMSQFILADEINRTSPKTQASLLEAMEERQVTVDGNTYKLPRPFMVLATQNPIEYLGTYPLPEAQLDRFFMKISIGYPSAGEERTILERYSKSSPILDIRPVASDSDIVKIQSEVREIFVHKALSDYIISIINATRRHQKLVLGASPRASLCLYRAAQARALMCKRDFVIPDDIKFVAKSVLSHRIVLKNEFKIERPATEEIIDEILEGIKIPLLEKK